MVYAINFPAIHQRMLEYARTHLDANERELLNRGLYPILEELVPNSYQNEDFVEEDFIEVKELRDSDITCYKDYIKAIKIRMVMKQLLSEYLSKQPKRKEYREYTLNVGASDDNTAIQNMCRFKEILVRTNLKNIKDIKLLVMIMEALEEYEYGIPFQFHLTKYNYGLQLEGKLGITDKQKRKELMKINLKNYIFAHENTDHFSSIGIVEHKPRVYTIEKMVVRIL